MLEIGRRWACDRALEQAVRKRPDWSSLLLENHRYAPRIRSTVSHVGSRAREQEVALFPRESETSLAQVRGKKRKKMMNYRVIANTFNPLTHRRLIDRFYFAPLLTRPPPSTDLVETKQRRNGRERAVKDSICRYFERKTATITLAQLPKCTVYTYTSYIRRVWKIETRDRLLGRRKSSRPLILIYDNRDRDLLSGDQSG